MTKTKWTGEKLAAIGSAFQPACVLMAGAEWACSMPWPITA